MNKLKTGIIGLLFITHIVAAQQEYMVYQFSKPGAPVLSVDFCTDGSLLAAGTEDKIIYVLNTESGELVYTINNNYYPVRDIRFTDSDILYVASGPDIKKINPEGNILQTCQGQTTHIWSIDMSGDLSKMIAGSYNKTVKMWDVQSGDVIRIFEGHEKSALAVALSNNGLLAASGSLDQSVRIWNTKTGELTQLLERHSDNIYSLAFHPSDTLLASASRDNTIRLWNVNTGDVVQSYIGHNKDVLDVKFTPDGNYLLSGSLDQTIRLWDVKSGKMIYSFIEHEDMINRLAVSPNGKYFASVSNDRSLILWKLDKRIFVDYYFYDEIEEAKEQLGVNAVKNKGESKQEYTIRIEKANLELQQVYETYYLQYLESLKTRTFKKQ
ncbi:MAG: WD40 repeat domain-containing protein [Bacteroidales bacterium]|nr:WD40 repeat domain-containing protein [Bacteroidales bacterium]